MKGKVTPIEKTWLSPKEASAYLGVSLSELRQIRDSGALRVYRRNQRCVWYEKENIDKYVRSCRIC